MPTITSASTNTGPIALPAQRSKVEQMRIRRPRHRKPIPDDHIAFLDDLLIRIGMGECEGRHRAAVVVTAGGAA